MPISLHFIDMRMNHFKLEERRLLDQLYLSFTNEGMQLIKSQLEQVQLTLEKLSLQRIDLILEEEFSEEALKPKKTLIVVHDEPQELPHPPVMEKKRKLLTSNRVMINLELDDHPGPKAFRHAMTSKRIRKSRFSDEQRRDWLQNSNEVEVC